MLLPRILSFLVLWGILVTFLIYRLPVATFWFSAALALVAQWEFYELQEAKGIRVFKKAGVCCGLLFFSFTFLSFSENSASHPLWENLAMVVIWVVILGALSRQLFGRDQSTALLTVALTGFGFFYVPYLFQFILRIIMWPVEQGGVGIYLAFYLVAVTKMTDAGAYLFGSFLGRTKMSPRISPKKTWEGFAGGVLSSLTASVLLVHFFPDELQILQGGHAWVLGLLLSTVSVVGDLAESLLKRDANLKNSGEIIPGIGGVLDLVDSLLFTGPFFYIYLTLLAMG